MVQWSVSGWWWLDGVINAEWGHYQTHCWCCVLWNGLSKSSCTSLSWNNPLNPSKREQNKRTEAVNVSDQPLSSLSRLEALNWFCFYISTGYTMLKFNSHGFVLLAANNSQHRTHCGRHKPSSCSLQVKLNLIQCCLRGPFHNLTRFYLAITARLYWMNTFLC